MSDQELADKIVAHGVGRIVGYDDRGQERVVLYRVDREVGTPPEKFVRDWRVAGAMIEKCMPIGHSFAIRSNEVDIAEGGFDQGSWSYGEQAANVMVDDSLPRAINEACAKALSA